MKISFYATISIFDNFIGKFAIFQKALKFTYFFAEIEKDAFVRRSLGRSLSPEAREFITNLIEKSTEPCDFWDFSWIMKDSLFKKPKGMVGGL